MKTQAVATSRFVALFIAFIVIFLDETFPLVFSAESSNAVRVLLDALTNFPGTCLRDVLSKGVIGQISPT